MSALANRAPAPGASAAARLTLHTREFHGETRQKVLDAIRALQAAGKPTRTAAIMEAAGVNEQTAVRWRKRLVNEGTVVCVRNKPGPVRGSTTTGYRGLQGESPAERQAIEAAIAEATARKRELDRGGATAALSVRIGRTGRILSRRKRFHVESRYDYDPREGD